MSKKFKETYDATMDVASFALAQFDQFYASHPDPEDEVTPKSWTDY